MAEIRLSKEQERAIYGELDKSVLVSAAAGSGKTFVMINRIFNLIKTGEADVDRMLVTTFTNAAAGEMKQRLVSKIRDEIRTSDDPELIERLNRQLDLMYRSYISTLDSFALRIVKEYFYEVDIEPGFQIIDSTEEEIMKTEVMQEFFDELFEKDELIAGFSFRDFLNKYSDDRTEDVLLHDMLDVYASIRSVPNYFDELKDKCELLKLPAGGYRDSEFMPLIKQGVIEKLTEALEGCEDVIKRLDQLHFDELIPKIEEDRESIFVLMDRVIKDGIYDGFFQDASGTKWARLTAPKEIKEEFEIYKAEISDARNALYKNKVKELSAYFDNPSLEEEFKEMDQTYPYARYYIELLEEFEKRFLERKREEGYMDFADVAHTAVKILEKPEISEIYRERFKYVFVDEYQDVNYLQEYFISLVSRPNNLFKVGDLKQSIYGFRQSEPRIFEETEKEYASDECSHATTIYLNKNFRSKGGIIKFVNDVFRLIMRSYDEKAKLNQGLMGFDEHDLTPEFHILTKNKAAEVSDEAEPIPLDPDEEIEELGTYEREASYIADKIASLLGTEYHNGDEKVVRKVEPKDIVILLRYASSKAEIFYNALRERGIAAHISNESGFFDTTEIEMATAILSLMDNMTKDVALIAVLHSEIFDFSPMELAEIRASFMESDHPNAGRERLISACEYYMEYKSDELSAKLKSAFDKINEWRRLASYMELDEYLWHILVDSNYYMYAGAVHGGRQRQANLRALVDMAGRYRESGVASLSGFIRYIGVVKDKAVHSAQASMVGEKDNLVRIMTMHKSKGLEFPFVFVPCMGARIKYDDSKKGFRFSKDIGVGLSYVDKEKHYWRKTIPEMLIDISERNKQYQEEIRVLYVAFTRAREKLFITASVRDESVVYKTPKSKTTFFDILKRTLDLKSADIKIVDAYVPGSEEVRNGLGEFLEKYEDMKNDLDPAECAEVASRLEYEYEFKDDLSRKAKYSVSELRRIKGEEDGRPKIRRKKDAGIPAAEIGTAYHRIMEFIDFGAVIKDDGSVAREYISEKAKELLYRGAISEEVFREIDIEKIAGFFESEIGRRTCEAARKGSLKKEKAFTYRMQHDGKDVLVQGIIDCCFEDEDGRYVLVDYKSSYVREWVSVDDEKKRIAGEYAEQIRIYREALEAGTGKAVKEAHLYLFSLGESIEI